MAYYIILAVVKIIDSLLNTFKSIATYREQKILSSALVLVSQLIFYLVISQVISDNTILAIIIVSVSSGIGNYIAFVVNGKLKKDAKWTLVITSSDKEGLKVFCDYLRECKIKYVVCNGHDRQWNETINIIAFSRTKEESRLIKQYLQKSNFTYLLEVI